MSENETLNQKVKLMESVLSKLDIKMVSKELNYAVNNKRRVLNLMNLLNTVSEIKIDTAKHQEYIEYANQIKEKMYEERKKQEVANASSGIDDTEVTPIDCFSYKIIDGNNVEITHFYSIKAPKHIKLPNYVNDLQVTYGDRILIPFVKIPNTINGLLVTSVGYGCFSFAEIDQLVFSSGITKIESHAFYRALIKMIRIPSSIQTIKTEAFFTRNDMVHILFENNTYIDKIPEFENAFPPNAVLYTDNIRLLNKLKEYKEVNRKYWDISDNVDEFELEWSLHINSKDTKR